jgi:hypothetical protein
MLDDMDTGTSYNRGLVSVWNELCITKSMSFIVVKNISYRRLSVVGFVKAV